MTGFVTRALALALFFSACATTNGGDGESESVEPPVGVCSLSLSRRESSVGLFEPPESQLEGRHYLEFVVTDVVNPAKSPAIFNVILIWPGGDEDIIGSFALFPPDNPGRFIVSLGKRAGPAAAVGLRLEFTDSLDAEDEFSVCVDVSVKAHGPAEEAGK